MAKKKKADKKRPTRKFTVHLETSVELELDEEVISRVINNIDNWQNVYYAFDKVEEVAQHIAYNLLINGFSLDQLDGWGDLPADYAKTSRPYWEVDAFEDK